MKTIRVVMDFLVEDDAKLEDLITFRLMCIAEAIAINDGMTTTIIKYLGGVMSPTYSLGGGYTMPEFGRFVKNQFTQGD